MWKAALASGIWFATVVSRGYFKDYLWCGGCEPPGHYRTLFAISLVVFAILTALTLIGFLLRLIPGDLGLNVRMVLALLVATLLLLVNLAPLAWLLTLEKGWSIVIFILIFPLGGFLAGGGDTPTGAGRAVKPRDRERVSRAAQRLAIQGDMPMPKTYVEQMRVPLSWTISVPWRKPAVHVTSGLLDKVDDPQLEAIVAHELSHIAHKDAVVMTILAGIPAAYLRGLRGIIEDEGFGGVLAVLMVGVWLLPTMLLLLATARILSRHRELIADRNAARLTGSPAAVASALVALSDDIARMRDRDLRKVSAGDVFHFLPAHPPRRLLSGFATHPRLEDRLALLHRMEVELQRAARP